ncbi:efflux RND transporter permease subunit [Cytobacillus sp. NCCP-133]|uniref:efflux RND transporter permease subunit n=1 Tax=Cytobacillus sp. NCCP-133 TaxID=766848 RepID=UPI00222E5489|nr:efflux RND transporter permease subunit [Cytobacillus sp. NCCP-133]GLB60678.1 transporter [Cytobacillus sp. NCCP-133]
MLGWILKRSKIFIILFVLFVIIGVFTFMQLPQREIPETTVNIGTVNTVYPGATVDSVERTITNPLESKLLSLNGIEEVSSSSAAGFSTLIVTVSDGEDKKEVFSNIRQAVSDAAAGFPEEAFEPEINEATVKMPVVSYHLTSEKMENLLPLQKDLERWKEEVESIKGVSSVTIKGLPEEEIVIQLDLDLLKENGIILPDVIDAINEEYYPTPIGKQEINQQVVQLTVDHYTSDKLIEDVYIGKSPLGEPVVIGDVGKAKIVQKQKEDIVTLDGEPSISFTAFVEEGQDIPTVDERVSEKVEELSEGLPENVTLINYYSQASLVTDVFDGLFFSLAISVIAVIVTTALGLTASGAFVVALAIPISVLMGLIPLPFVEVDLNQISVIGAIIALGILVDDSIVVNDNIQRRYKLGDNAFNGAVNGTKEIWVSIVTSSLAIVFTFMPLIFLSGGNGAFIRALPTVLITTILASTLVALIFVPMLRFMLYRKTSKKVPVAPGLLGRPLNKAADVYADKILKPFSKKPKLAGILGLVFTTAIFGLAAFTPFEFFPAADRKEVTIDVSLPIGTTLEETAGELEKIEKMLLTDEGVKETSVFAGTGLPYLFNSSLNVTGPNTGQIAVRVDREKQTAQGLIDDWISVLREEYPGAEIFMETIQQGPPAGAPVTVTVKGPEVEKLLEIRDGLTAQMEGAGADFVVDNIGKPEPTLKYVPNRELLKDYDIKVNQISEQIRLATKGIPLKAFDNGVAKRDMSILLGEKDEPLDLTKLEVAAGSAAGGSPSIVSLDTLVDEKRTEEIQRIPHLNGDRAITLRAFPKDEDNFKDNIQKVVDKEREKLDDQDYSISIGGENQAQNDFFAEITVLFIIVIFLVYLLIAFQFNSLGLPFLVLIAVYLALAGAILGLFVTQTPISFLAVMGMVSLTGIVVRNAVVLIEFMEQGLRSGMPIKEAVVEAGRTRIRPILLTALTSIVALVPVAASGDTLFMPLAITIISGIMFSVILTLIIVPMMYLAFKKVPATYTTLDQ